MNIFKNALIAQVYILVQKVVELQSSYILPTFSHVNSSYMYVYIYFYSIHSLLFTGITGESFTVCIYTVLLLDSVKCARSVGLHDY